MNDDKVILRRHILRSSRSAKDLNIAGGDTFEQFVVMRSLCTDLTPHLLAVWSASATIRFFAVGAGRPMQSRTLSSTKAPQDGGATAVWGGADAAGAGTAVACDELVTMEMMRVMMSSRSVPAVRPHKASRNVSATVACTVAPPALGVGDYVEQATRFHRKRRASSGHVANS